jgi:hypothetical protein
MKLSPPTRKHWVLILGFAVAAGCSVQVLPGAGSNQGGGGSTGAGAGIGDSRCTPTCDCHTFCEAAEPCYALNFDMPECLRDCESNVPGDLRQAVCNAGTNCDAVHALEADVWYGAGSCAPWTGGGGASIENCLNCWNVAATGACFLDERAYEADSSALDIATCVDQGHYTTNAIIECEHQHAQGVVDWDTVVGCAACGVCTSACVGTELSDYICGVDGPTTD